MLQDQNSSNFKLIEDLNSEKERVTNELRAKEKELVKLHSQLMQTTKDLQHEKERAQQFERHIKELKEQEG